MKISVQERIDLNVPVLDTANGQTTPETLTIADGMTTLDITIPDNRAYPFTLQTLNLLIRNALRERVITQLKANVNRDVGELIQAEVGSPPRIISFVVGRPRTDEEWVDYARQHSVSVYRVVGSDNPSIASNLQMFGQERVFQSTAPEWMRDQRVYYKNTSEDLTCGYEYLIKYSERRHNSCKKQGGSVKAINHSIAFTNPNGEVQTEYHEIFDAWKNRYYEQMCGVVDGEIHPIPDYISVGDLYDEDEIFQVEELNLRDLEWGDYDKERSLSIIDIVRWCIVAQVRLCVLDSKGVDYIQYNPEDFYAVHPTKKQKKKVRSLCLKVAYNHAYFVEDSDKKNSIVKRFNIFNERMSDPGQRILIKNEKAEAETLPQQHHDLIGGGAKPTSDQLKDWAKDTESVHYYHTGKECLNEVVHSLYKDGLVPDGIRGAHQSSISFAKYGNLRVVPSEGEFYKCDTTGRQDEFFEEYKEVFKDNRTPTPTKIATDLYKKIYPDEPILGKMNRQVKHLFFDSEIKPDTRKKKNCMETLSSYDLNSAYTTAIKNNTSKYQVYDVLTQIEKYNGNFNPDWFYLAKNRYTNKYPCINAPKGKLILYHGSLLKYCSQLDLVEIKYQIRPAVELEPDHFDPFVEECKKYCDRYNQVFVGAQEKQKHYKGLINPFVGSLKHKDGVKGFSLYLETDPVAVARGHRETRFIPKRLKEGDDIFIIAYPKRVCNLENAQPIRLQVMSICSEMNYKVYLHYEICFKNKIPSGTPTLGATNTDAIKVRQPYKNDADLQEIREMENWFDRQEALDKCPNYQKNQAFEREMVKTFNETHDFKIKQENQIECHLLPDTKPQRGFSGIANKWEDELYIHNKWSRNIGAKLLLRLAYQNKGAWFAGMGGRGKSELIKEMTEACRWNCVRYKYIRAVCKTMNPEAGKEARERWLARNPISCMKLAPTNKASNNIRGKTLHKGLGVSFNNPDESDDEDEDEEQPEQQSKAFMDKILMSMEGRKNKGDIPLGVLAFDEISMIGAEFWGYISHIRQRMPDLIILLFGDIEHQLPPVKEERRQFNDAFAIKDIANFMKITLGYNFRTGKKRDRLWELSGKPEDIKITNRPLPNRNLSHTNARRMTVIKYKQDKLVNPVVIEKPETDKNDQRQTLKYVVGTPMIANKSFGKDDDRVAKNEAFQVASLEPLTLQRMDGSKLLDRYITIDKEQLYKKFFSGYCITIHKAQGETYDDYYCIHEWNEEHLMRDTKFHRKLRYTALSRSTNPKNKISFRA